MPKKPRQIPSYRQHKPTGQAVVTLSGKDYYLGKCGSEESHEKYERLIAEWRQCGYRPPGQIEDTTVNELIVAYWEQHVESHYVKNGHRTSEQSAIKVALGSVRQLYGRAPATEFGPLALKTCRQAMIDAGWVRSSINIHVGRIRRMFKWAAANELVSADVFHALQTVSGLQKGRTDAKESEPVKPVPAAFIEAVEPHVTWPVWGMIQTQLLTGMRPGEAMVIRGRDLETSGTVWIYVPESHKTEHHGRRREIYVGPKAQVVVREYLKPDLQAYLFSPRDAVGERKGPRRPGERYTVWSYRRAVVSACEKAGVPPWHPNQLRHNAGTLVRKEADLETAQVILGHANADVTQIYAERDRDRAIEFMARFG